MTIKTASSMALCWLGLSVFAPAAFADGECVSDLPAIGVMQRGWDKPTQGAADLHDSFGATQVTLAPYAEAAARLGTPAIKAKKNIAYFDQYLWKISRDGDYWTAADSGVWIDILGTDGVPLAPLVFNHGLRCAGIFKAVKFHLTAGSYRVVIASETTSAVKFSGQLDSAR